MIDSTTIERVRAASDIVNVIRQTIALKSVGKELRGLCPFHDDHQPSLAVNPEKQRWFCHPCGTSGDVFKFVMLRDDVTFPVAVSTLAANAGIQIVTRRTLPRHEGITVSQLARAKNLEVDVLQALGIMDGVWKGSPAVFFPYFVTGQDEKPVAIHVRRTLAKTADVSRFEWRKGDEPLPYGLWLLPTSNAKERGFVLLVEGETDVVTLIQQNIPAIGVPGNHWKESWSRFLDDVDRIVVVVERDDGGRRLVESLRKSSLWARCSMNSISPSVATTEGVA